MEANWRSLTRAQKEGVLGRVAEDRNWIGLSRCRSPDVLFLGVLAAPAACAAACRDHDACYAWTFNKNNAMIAGTEQECWGGTSNLALTTQPWGGFVSGGMPCAKGEACR
jgi:hypothetical protein